MLLGVIGISFAYWLSTATQQSINKITSGCLQVTIEDITEAINLSEAYPITDSEAATLEPYTFKVENICNNAAEYNINLEVLEAEHQLSSNYVAVSFDGGSKKLLTSYPRVEETYNDEEYKATESYNLFANGTLAGKESKNYTIKLWIDETAEGKDIMNQTFLSKISVTSGVSKPSPTPNTLASQVEIGDYISMTPTSTSYTIPGSETGCTTDRTCGAYMYITDQTINPSELNLWRVIKKNDDGTVDAVSEYISSIEIYFGGLIGYLNLVGTLNKIAASYENGAYTVGSRHIGYNGQTEYIIDTLTANPGPWTTTTEDHRNQYEYQSTPESSTHTYEVHYNVRYINNNIQNAVMASYLNAWTDNRNSGTISSHRICPIVTLKSDLTVSGGGKSESDPFVLK